MPTGDKSPAEYGSAGFNLHVKIDKRTKAMMRKLKKSGELKGKDIDKIAGKFIRRERNMTVIPAIMKATGLKKSQARKRVRVPSKKTTKRRHGVAGYVIETWGSAQVVAAGQLKLTLPPRGSRKGKKGKAGDRGTGLTVRGKHYPMARIYRGRKYGRHKKRRVYLYKKTDSGDRRDKALSFPFLIPKTYARLRPQVYARYGKRMKREITVLVQRRFKSL